MAGNADDFWDFSLAFYARPGAAEALIGLQDRHRLDVNLILFGLWLGCSGRGRLDAAGLAAAERAVAPLRTAVTEPMRDLRRRLKDHPDRDVQGLRERVKALELEAERAAQRRLSAVAGEPIGAAAAERGAAAAANLAVCLGPAAGSAEAAALRKALAEFLRSARP